VSAARPAFPVRVCSPQVSELSIEWDQWPVLIVDLRSEMTAAMMDAYMAAVAEALARQEPFANVFLSVTPGHKFERQLLRPMADFTNAHRAELAKHCLGAAIVLGTPAARFILSSFLLLVRTANPVRAFSAAEPAREWIDSLLTAAGLKSPPGLAKRLAASPAT
jgi:hypothetical protein